MIDAKLDEVFNKDIYNVKAEYFDDDKLMLNVYKLDSTTDDITGKYTFNINSEEMIKL